MTKLMQTFEWVMTLLNERAAEFKELEAKARALEEDRNRWYLRAVRMATADDLYQWAREGDRKGDMVFLEDAAS